MLNFGSSVLEHFLRHEAGQVIFIMQNNKIKVINLKSFLIQIDPAWSRWASALLQVLFYSVVELLPQHLTHRVLI